jgi:hypothetical protein
MSAVWVSSVPGSVNVALTDAVAPSTIESPTATTTGATLVTVTVVLSSSVSAVAGVTSPPTSLTVSSITSTVSSTALYTGVALVASSRFAAGDHEKVRIAFSGSELAVPSSWTVEPSGTEYGPPAAATGAVFVQGRAMNALLPGLVELSA